MPSVMDQALEAIKFHSPRFNGKDLALGAVLGGALGTGTYGLKRLTGKPEDEKPSLATHVALGSLLGAGASSVGMDRARRYISNNLIPAGYGAGSSNQLEQLRPKSIKQVFQTLLADRPSDELVNASRVPGGGPLGAKSYVLGPRTELLRRAMGLPVRNQEQAWFKSLGETSYKPTETSGGLSGTFETVGLNKPRWEAETAKPESGEYLKKLMTRVRHAAKNPGKTDRYFALGDWLSRHGYVSKGDKLEVSDLWDFALTPKENELLRHYVGNPGSWRKPMESFEKYKEMGSRSPIDLYDTSETGHAPTQLEHLGVLLKRKLLNDWLLRKGGVLFKNDFDKRTGQPVFAG